MKRLLATVVLVAAFLAVDHHVARASGAIGAVGGGGVAQALVCVLTGGADCTMTGGIIFSGVTTDITAASGEDVLIVGGASTGSVVLKSIDNITQIQDASGNVDMQFSMEAAGGVRSTICAVSPGACVLLIGSTSGSASLGPAGSVGPTIAVAHMGEGVSTAGSTLLHSFFGGGINRVATHQAAACAAGVLALDPTSSVIDLDANSAACAVTLAETTAATVGPGFDVQINVVTASGGGGVTFPDVAGIHDGPLLCTTTGLQLNGSYTIHYANMADDMFIGKSCETN